MKWYRFFTWVFYELQADKIIGNLANLALSEIIELLMAYKIYHFYSKNEKNDYDCIVSFDEGCMLFYDWNNTSQFNIKNLKLKFNSKCCITQGEYVIFLCQNVFLDLNIEETVENCKDYELLDLQDINDEAIIIHK